ncbi:MULTISPECIES: lipocalin-like domain-containing protein [unclassified Moorena]|uniref:lipocalin-like domain-containing protein n=1 Tax=unclassified Moorena TaxID=2683338 RepID=UPI001400E76C|nr:MULTISPECIES: lipocalin-like domain-containing protein [unclassified Moorena]NEO13878.1 lipocalin-like domain-containing protein [Moorena sp. SIO3E8]NEQ00272.1 lipocalin-like domain-containing protein [Moorena sp. SIO3F7]
MTPSIVSKDAFVGTWKLAELKSVDKEQKISYPYGKNPVGHIIYTKEGYMSASIMMSNRLNLGLSMEEIQNLRNVSKLQLITNILKYIKVTFRYFMAARNYISYSGKYEIRDNKVIHHVEVSLIPDWTGIDLERNFELSEDILVLTASSVGNTFYLTWQRVS